MSPLRPGSLAAVLLAAFAGSSHATVLPITAGTQWNVFHVDELIADSFGVEWIDNADSLSPQFGTPLAFAFTIAGGFTGTLTIVDAGFAGDTFEVTNFGQLLGSTSSVPAQTDLGAPHAGMDFDAALGQPSFSRGVFELGAGSYLISGGLAQSVAFEGGGPLNATVGGLRLTVAPVPEPSTWAALAGGLGLMGLASRRRRDAR